jgi:carbon starvation protein
VYLATAVAVVAMYATVVAGHWLQLAMPDVTVPLTGFTLPAVSVWILVLLVYAFIASTLPVTTLLQPRDFINGWQLFIAMGLLLVGAVSAASTAGLEIVAPALNSSPTGAPPLWPFLFVTIACGAISGFHCLVASGTTPKQVSREGDALFVGYGSMLLEGALAVLVIVAVAAGIGMRYELVNPDTGEVISVLAGREAWLTHYASWQGAAGLTSKLEAVVTGSANMMSTFGVPVALGTIIMGVFIASFAGTTLDTATRIQRYVIAELGQDLRVGPLMNRYVATGIAIVSAATLAFVTGANGQGAMKLWPMFGAVNQLLASLALLIVTVYLKRRLKWGWLVTALPMLFMLVMTHYAMVLNELTFVRKGDWLLVIANALVQVLAVWMTIEAIIVFFKGSARLVEEPSPAAAEA